MAGKVPQCKKLYKMEIILETHCFLLLKEVNKLLVNYLRTYSPELYSK